MQSRLQEMHRKMLTKERTKKGTCMPFILPSLDNFTIGSQRRAFNCSLVQILSSHDIDVRFRTTLTAQTFVLSCATRECKNAKDGS